MNRLRYVLVFLWGCATAPASDAPPRRFTYVERDDMANASIYVVRDTVTGRCAAVYSMYQGVASLGEVPCGP